MMLAVCRTTPQAGNSSCNPEEEEEEEGTAQNEQQAAPRSAWNDWTLSIPSACSYCPSFPKQRTAADPRVSRAAADVCH